MRLGLSSFLAIVAACNAPHVSRATETQNEVCQVLADADRAAAVRAAQTKWDVPAPLLLAFMRQESNFKPDKRPASTSGPYGYPQAALATWNLYKKETGNLGASRNNFADSIDFIGWYAAETRGRTSAPYSNMIAHYLAYSRGPAAAGPASPAAKRNAQRVAAYAQAYQRDLKSCPITEPSSGLLAFLSAGD